MQQRLKTNTCLLTSAGSPGEVMFVLALFPLPHDSPSKGKEKKTKKTTANRGLMEAEWNVGAPPKLGAGRAKERQWRWREVEREEGPKSSAKCTFSRSLSSC